MIALAFPPLLAFVVSAAAAWFLARTKASFLPEDAPNARSLHAVSTPRTGGLAILLGLGVAAASWGRFPHGSSWWLLAATLLIASMSFADDRRGLPPALRLALQTVAAAAVVWGGSLFLSNLSIPALAPIPLGGLAPLVSVAGLVWFANLYNFMDGLDGLAGAMTLFGGTFLGAAFIIKEDRIGALAAFALAAAAGGFLLRNFPPASIFMGDCGSVTIGFLFGILILRGVREGSFPITVPLVVFAPFVVDATVTLFVRIVAGERIWQPHRSHLYQRLVLTGTPRRVTLLLESGGMLLCGSLSLLMSFAAPRLHLCIFGGVALSSSLAVRLLARTDFPAPQPGAGSP